MPEVTSDFSIDTLQDRLRIQPGRPAMLRVRAGRLGTLLTRGELCDLIDEMASGLHSNGLESGDTIALAVAPGPRALAVVLAAIRLRLRVALVDPTVGPDVVVARLRLAKPRLVVTDVFAQFAAGPAALFARRFGLHLPKLDRLARVVTIGTRFPGIAPALEQADRVGRAVVPDRRGDNADAIVIFTSGTTSTPRAVVHTVASVSAAVDAASALVRPQQGSTVLGGTFFVMVPGLMNGAAILRPGRTARVIASRIALARPDVTYLTPPQARSALARGAHFSGRVYCGSSPVSANLLRCLREAGALEAWGVYAMTEAFPIAAVEAEEKVADEQSHGATGADLVGQIISGMRVKSGADGELLVRGAGLADRYLGEQPFKWVRTGDRGEVVDDRVRLSGRIKDMVIRRAENIYPGLYEPALHVDGVDLAVLVGVPAGDGDELLALMIQTTEGHREDSVRTRLKPVLESMGSAKPDFVVFAEVPTSGRSRKPDRGGASARADELSRTLNRRVWWL